MRSRSMSFAGSRASVSRSRQSAGQDNVDPEVLLGQTWKTLEGVQKQNDGMEPSLCVSGSVADSKSGMKMSQSTEIARAQGRKQQQLIKQKFRDIDTLI